jgi:hypothetical protein
MLLSASIVHRCSLLSGFGERFWRLLVLVPLLRGISLCGADPRVAVFSDAEPEYLQTRRDEAGNLRNETYFVVAGTYFPGQIVDRTLERTTLAEIARMLAPELAKQNYTPAASIASAELMLVVHWGTTVRARSDNDYIVDAQRQQRDALDLRAELQALNSNGAGAPPDVHPNLAVNRSSESKGDADQYFDSMMNDLYWGAGSSTLISSDRITENLIGSSVASLLGFAKDLRAEALKPFGSERGRTFRAMLEDERYFIIVMAYDFPAFQASGFKETRRLWTCRLSMHSPGVNFRQAVFRIGAVGSNYFGTHTPEVTIERPQPKEGIVEVGEPTVVSW